MAPHLAVVAVVEPEPARRSLSRLLRQVRYRVAVANTRAALQGAPAAPDRRFDAAWSPCPTEPA
ncbi:MAG: hypothetical protein M3083_03290 [Actinomycetota bacterium]|nr:hypothetical protein [Actinomycetota bacterium]MDQ6946884.1 hypothetical protein [Actinomycetota bacterium]